MRKNPKYRELTNKKYELILRLIDWQEKLELAKKRKDTKRIKQIENTIKQLESNLLKIEEEIEKIG